MRLASDCASFVSALVPDDQIALIQREIQALIDDNAIDGAPPHIYHHLESIARRRIPRDPND